MAVRQVYSCDWCNVDSSSAGSIGSMWKVTVLPTKGGDKKAILCEECGSAVERAVETCRQQCAERDHKE